MWCERVKKDGNWRDDGKVRKGEKGWKKVKKFEDSGDAK